MNRKTTKKVDESTLTTLCAVCRGAFLDAKGVHLRMSGTGISRKGKEVKRRCLRRTCVL